MSRLSLLLVCLALFVCVGFASSATPSPAVQKTRLAAKSNSNAQQSSAVVAVSKATAEAKVGILAFGVWLHDKAPVTEDRSLLKLHAKVAHPKDDKRHGLATRKAPSAHYATLRLDNTWSASEKYCGSVGGSLCTYKQVCPQGQGKPAIGSTEIPFNRRSWAPIKDGSNKWVNMEPGPYAGPEARCVTADNPDWGRTKKTLKEINQDWENHSKSLVPCCNAEGVMKSYLRPGSKYPGRHAKDEEVGPLHDLPVYYIPVSVLGGSHVGPWGNVKAPLRDQAEWIWNDPEAIRGVPAQTRPLEFQLRYVAKQEYKNAVIHFVIDDVGTVFVNGKQVATGGGGWGNANPSKATINLRKGLNVIEFHNKNGGGPAGFIAACWHGNLKLFQTDKTWTTSRRGV